MMNAKDDGTTKDLYPGSVCNKYGDIAVLVPYLLQTESSLTGTIAKLKTGACYVTKSQAKEAIQYGWRKIRTEQTKNKALVVIHRNAIIRLILILLCKTREIFEKLRRALK